MVVALVTLGRHARSADLLAPVVVGGLLRLAVMAIAHAGSLHLGDGGLLFLDDRGYFERGELLASAWRAGELIDPAAIEYAGTYQFGYPALMGSVFTLVGHSVLPAKLVNVLAGTTTVLLVGLLSGRVIGECSRKRAAWAAALFPTLVWWSAPLMKEAVTTLLVVAALYAATYIPRRSAVTLTTALLAALFITRSGAALVVAIAIGSALVLAGVRSRNIGREQWIRAAGGGCAVALVGLAVLSGGDFGALALQYQSTIQNMIERYQGSDPYAVPFDAVRTLVTPLPWTFDLATRNWDRGLYPGVWALYLAYPVAVFGAWRLRRKPELALLLIPLVLSIVLNAFTSGFPFRQRSVVEPLILLLAVAGTASYRQAAQWGSLALGAVALVATAHTRSPATGLAIAAGAVALCAISRRLPGETLDSPSAESTLVNSIEREPRESSLAGFKKALRAMRAGARAPRAVSLDHTSLKVGMVVATRLRSAGSHDLSPRPAVPALAWVLVTMRRSVLAALRAKDRFAQAAPPAAPTSLAARGFVSRADPLLAVHPPPSPARARSLKVGMVVATRLRSAGSHDLSPRPAVPALAWVLVTMRRSVLAALRAKDRFAQAAPPAAPTSLAARGFVSRADPLLAVHPPPSPARARSLKVGMVVATRLRSAGSHDLSPRPAVPALAWVLVTMRRSVLAALRAKDRFAQAAPPAAPTSLAARGFVSRADPLLAVHPPPSPARARSLKVGMVVATRLRSAGSHDLSPRPAVPALAWVLVTMRRSVLAALRAKDRFAQAAPPAAPTSLAARGFVSRADPLLAVHPPPSPARTPTAGADSKRPGALSAAWRLGKLLVDSPPPSRRWPQEARRGVVLRSLRTAATGLRHSAPDVAQLRPHRRGSRERNVDSRQHFIE